MKKSLVARRQSINAGISRKTFAILLLGVVLVLTIAGCTSTIQSKNQKIANSQASKLDQAEPYPLINDSQELRNLRTRTLRLNDPNRVAYVYLFSQDGKIIAEYQIIGKVTSTNSQYASPEAVVAQNNNASGSVVISNPQPDGSYGQNEPGIFFFIDDANKTMITWSGIYLESDQPINLQQPPEIVVVPNGK